MLFLISWHSPPKPGRFTHLTQIGAPEEEDWICIRMTLDFFVFVFVFVIVLWEAPGVTARRPAFG